MLSPAAYLRASYSLRVLNAALTNPMVSLTTYLSESLRNIKIKFITLQLCCLSNL